jgi:hypothetical protein
MKSFFVKRKSWHFRLASHYGDYLGLHHELSMCNYARAVLKGLLKAVFVAFAIGMVGSSFVCLIMSFGIGMYYHVVLPLMWQEVLAFAITVVGSACVLAVGLQELVKRIKKHYTQRPKIVKPNTPGFLKTAYNVYKEKACIPIVVEPEPKEDYEDI